MRFFPLAVVSLALAACSPPDASAPAASAAAPAVQTDQDKTLYALGLAIGQNVQDFKLTEAEIEIVALGLHAEDGVAEQANLPGAQRSDSGVVVIPMTEGTGESPTATSTVRVHYHGTLRDGSVFDSSVDRGEPISFPLSNVISCWTEGVQKIKVGGKAKLVCPSETAYGDQGSGSIPGGAALAFEVELLAIE